MTDLLTENARLRAALLVWEAAFTGGDHKQLFAAYKNGRATLDSAALATPAPDAPMPEHERDGFCRQINPATPQNAVYLGQHSVAPAPDAVQEAAIDIEAIENGGKRWHGEDHRVVSVRWEPYKPDGQRQMKAKGRWQEQVGSGDYWRWQNCDRPAALRAITGDRT